MEEQGIRLHEVFNSLKKRLIIIVGLTLIASIISATLNFFVIKPKYEKPTKIFIGKDESEDQQEAKIILENITNRFIEKSKELIPNRNVEVIETVEQPEKTVSLNKAINIVIVGALGLIIGALIVIFIEFLDNTYKNKDKIEKELDLPVLGTIPKGKGGNKFIIKKEPKLLVAESCRTLRTNLQYSFSDEDAQVIVITSPEPGEGKSTTAVNLAMSLIQDGKIVILIDCDFKKPSLHKRFKLSNTIGLSEVLIGSHKLAEAAQMYNNNLIVLTSGNVPSNPAELLDSKALTNLIENLKFSFDYIILDSSSVQSVTDSQILSSKANGTILVVKAQKTKRDLVKNAIEFLKMVNANILGIVLNGAEGR